MHGVTSRVEPAQHGMAQHSMARHGTVQHSIAHADAWFPLLPGPSTSAHMCKLHLPTNSVLGQNQMRLPKAEAAFQVVE